MSATFTILIADSISPKGIELLSANPSVRVIEKTGLTEDQLIEVAASCEAILVRSQTKITRRILEKADRLRVVGRAGVGVDNVDVAAATERGIVVMNTPGGNTIATAEQTVALLLALARSIPQADASMRAGAWNRKAFEGVELCGKVLGIVGMGRVGTEVARRALGFNMRVICFDPYLSPARVQNLPVQVADDLDTVLKEADFLTLHSPLTPETKGLLDARRLALCKKGVRIVNCARGALIVPSDLREAIDSGHVAGAALDVFDPEPPPADFPLRSLSKVILTPHLAASTAESQEQVGIQIAQAVLDLLENGTIRNAVNIPNVDPRTAALLRPYLSLAERLGLFMGQWAPNRISRVALSYAGKINEYDTTPVTRAALKGLLRKAAGSEVNEVNAAYLAETLGIVVSEVKTSQAGEFTDWIGMEIQVDSTSLQAGATFWGSAQRLVQINGNPIEAPLEGALLVLENRDCPGIVGRVGSILGERSVNIASMSLARTEQGSRAVSVLHVDAAPGSEVLEEILRVPDVYSVRLVQI
ncbi:phosphoglycerate dehydrogenase [Methylacidimicrobium tartarophylax]|uniref:D-3-phosphoglycerate dehydrogenase n=1 Tax=Methylacidimicrobium tartarophylax TaxID=1041768 RepID=A0A5E6MHG3_9BACT|nr:phosphoglycerate dehydrogenase [Methylacidimicrobium tartarophylax]VVM07337.1 D-3-phosphoglycerate dehydrogenase / 2-oxoglutarate reductase [Methylacidimicrobium tartarophylax]